VLTSADVAEAAAAFARGLGKSPVAAGDRAGFIVNGLLFAYLNQAAAMYESRYATREDIDAAMRLGCGLPMGPLALLDLIGVDVAKTVLEAMYAQSHDRLHAPAPVLGQLVAAGLLGRKTGRGFYTYAAPGSSQPVAEPDAHGDAVAVAGRQVRSVGVCGSGTMATGIAEVFAKAGYGVTLVARSQEKADRAKAALAKSLERMVAKGRLGEADRDAALARVTASGSLEDLSSADLVLEAVAEDLAVKQELFATLDKICRPGAVLATTTSSLPVIQCAMATGRPQDVVGMHFFNPAPAMRLVEVVSTVLTGPDVTATVLELCTAVRKHPVECGDRAGFIVNALLFPYLNDAVRMIEEHYASVDDVDTAMQLGCGYPMGPFALLDVVGLDVSLTIEKVLHGEFREPGLAPAPLLEHLVAAGCLGRKTGRGFRDHARR
jgi:3-hydroxybutyryl-CoA dehydrogenase